MSDAGPEETLAQRREATDKWAAGASLEWQKLYPATLTDEKIAGVPVRNVVPAGLPDANKDKVLLCLHGGGFNSDSGSYTESIPMAGMTKIRVVAVLYRLAPEFPFPAAVDDSIAVYKELLKTYKPDHIVIYGTSAGAILTGEVAVKIKQLGLPMPAALGIFSGMGDFARAGDSISLYALRGFSGHLDAPDESAPHDPYYTGKTDPKDPVLSPNLCRPPRHASHALHNQRPRYAAQRHHQSASRLFECRQRCSANCVRRAASCLLVFDEAAGSA